MSLYKYFKKIDGTADPAKSESVATSSRGDTSNQETQIRSTTMNLTENKETTKKDQSSLHKKRRKRWNDDNIAFGFFRPVEEASNPFPPAKCLFCDVTYNNANVVPSKLDRHLKTKHPEHQNKSKQFFEATLKAYSKQQATFKSQVSTSDTKSLTLASLKMTHIILQKKKPFTELESVVLPCLQVAADLIHGGKEAVKKVNQIPLSDTTTSRRSRMLADDLKEQLIAKLRLASSFGIQLDETTDIGGEAQLIVYCRFPGLEEKTMVEHYLCCLQLGVETTANSIFQKLNGFFVKESIDWSKCKSVTTDGAKAMVGAINGVVRKIQDVSPNCVPIHCVIHREALVAKKLNEARNVTEKNDFELLLDDVVKMVNHIRAHAKKHRIFSELCKDMEANFTKLLLHAEVRWLSRGKVLNRVLALREELCVFLTEEANPMAVKCQDTFWLAKLSYMASVFDHLNKLNISQQGKGGDIFTSMGKINGFKLKVKKWKSNVEKRCFSDFEIFDKYMKECGWEHGMQEGGQTLEVKLSQMIIKHLTLLQENLDYYFPESDNDYLASKMWVLNPFSDDGTDHSDALLELKTDYSQKAAFKTFGHPMDFWISLLNIAEYKDLADQATAMFVQMPTSYLCEQGFSSLVLIKTKKRNAILNLDPLMRVALENRLMPRFSLIADKVHQQPSH